MGAPSERVRAGRNRPRAAVAVTGAAFGVGRLLAARLVEDSRVRRVVAIDQRRGDLDRVTWRVLDVTDPRLVTRLSGCDTVVHTLVDVSVSDDPGARGRHTVRAAQTVLTAAAAAGVRRVVVVTSAMVYGARPDNPLPLPEDAPLHAHPDGDLLSDLLEVEALAERSRRAHPGTAVTVVRPAMLVGPGIDTVLTRHFESPRLLVVRGSRPAWQFCHVEDLASALHVAALEDVGDVVAVGCDGWLDQAQVEALSGRGSIELPPTLAFGTAERLHRLGITPAPASELHYVAHPWAVETTRLRAAGWRPVYDNATALEALLQEAEGRVALGSRRLGRRETATLGAAGATMAVLGTAAVVRRTRRRRRH